MKLIENWRAAPRMFSMWCFAIIFGLSAGWAGSGYLTGHEYLVGPVGQISIAVLAFVGAIMRIVAQPTLQEEKEDNEIGL